MEGGRLRCGIRMKEYETEKDLGPGVLLVGGGELSFVVCSADIP